MKRPARNTGPRIAREKRTIRAMVRVYCLGRGHAGRRPCLQCAELLTYALCRLDRCPFGEDKTVCARCPVHCYKPAMRARVKEVMRYAGPRMLLHDPLLALLHQLDAWRSRRSQSAKCKTQKYDVTW